MTIPSSFSLELWRLLIPSPFIHSSSPYTHTQIATSLKFKWPFKNCKLYHVPLLLKILLSLTSSYGQKSLAWPSKIFGTCRSLAGCSPFVRHPLLSNVIVQEAVSLCNCLGRCHCTLLWLSLSSELSTYSRMSGVCFDLLLLTVSLVLKYQRCLTDDCWKSKKSGKAVTRSRCMTRSLN